MGDVFLEKEKAEGARCGNIQTLRQKGPLPDISLESF